MNFIKRNFFGFLIAMIIISSGTLFVAMIISPKEDLQKRGFIPCTEKFVQQASACENSKTCLVGGIFEHMVCGFEVLGEGFSKWIDGEQKTPWENYIFSPIVEVKNNEHMNQEGIDDLYRENPNIVEDMIQTQKLHEEMIADEK